MTAKEKAIDLIKKIILADNLDKGTPIEKQCALICVDEMISEHLDEGINSYVQKRIDYWSEVKQEINKL
mgnify:CR=1 FL=1